MVGVFSPLPVEGVRRRHGSREAASTRIIMCHDCRPGRVVCGAVLMPTFSRCWQVARIKVEGNIVPRVAIGSLVALKKGSMFPAIIALDIEVIVVGKDELAIDRILGRGEIDVVAPNAVRAPLAPSSRVGLLISVDLELCYWSGMGSSPFNCKLILLPTHRSAPHSRTLTLHCIGLVSQHKVRQARISQISAPHA